MNPELIKEYCVPAIMVGVYLLLAIVKPIYSNTKYIPLTAGLLGIGLNWWMNGNFNFNIFLTGLASGLAATGLDQLFKQTTGYYEKSDETKDEDPTDDTEQPTGDGLTNE